MKIQAKPVVLDVIKWENNEAEVRAFVQDDKALKFKDRGLEVWNSSTQSWEICHMFYFIAKTTRGTLLVVSPNDFENYYTVIE